MSSLRASLVIAVVAGLWSSVFGQPVHTREIFRYDLTTPVTPYGRVIDPTGSFTASGWRPTDNTHKIQLALADYLPYEGTLEVQIKGLSADNVTKDWIPFSIWSRQRGTFYQKDGESFPSEGSFIFAKTDAGKATGGKVAFKLFTKSQYDPVKSNYLTADVDAYAYNAASTYTLRYIWKPGTIWFQVWLGSSKLVEKSTSWLMQDEAFLYVFLGKNGEYSSMTSMTYSNLVLKAPDKNITFNDVSKSTGIVVDTTLNGQGISWADLNNDGKEDIYASYFNLANRFFTAVLDSEKFRESAASYGLNDAGPSFATATADFNGDGKLDAFLTNYGGAGRLFINQGASFSDQTSAWNINTGASSINPLVFDLENDGDIDLFIANSGTANELYINQNNSSFIRTELSTLPSGTGARAVAGDVNKDGYVDIFYPRRNAAATLLINNKSGGFTDQANAYGLAITTDPNAPTLADLDNDGYLDLLLSVISITGDSKPQVLYYRNSGGGSFSKSGTIYIECYGAIVGDVDNDGLQDLYFIKRNRLSSENPDNGSRLYRNTSSTGSISFSEYTGTGLEAIFQDGRGGAMADFNGDGKLDIYGSAKGTTGSSGRNYGRNFLFKNVSSNTNGFLTVDVLDKKKVSGYLGAKVELFGPGGVTGPLLGYREISSIQGYQSQPSRLVHFGMGANTDGVLRVTLPGGQLLTRSVTRNELVRIDLTGGDAKSFILVKGDNQTGVAGTQLNDSLTVRVYAVSDELRPLAGHNVTFTVTQGGGMVNGANSATISTDLYGLARAAFRLGQSAGNRNNQVTISSLNKSGAQIINLSAPGSPAAPITILATANPGAAAKMEKVSGEGQNGYIYEVLKTPIIIKVTDQFGNPISGYTVTFNVATGGGGFGASGTSPQNMVTDPDGKAQVLWRMGPSLGLQTLQVYGAFNAASPYLFSASASEPLRRLTYESGDRQSAKVGQLTEAPLVVRLRDYQGNAIANTPVQFAVVAGGGKINGLGQLDVNTSPDGLASIKPTMGSVVGDTNNVFQATSVGASGTITFKISATAGTPTKMQYTSGDNRSGKVARTLSAPFVVRVTDASLNGVSGYFVDFNVTAGGGSFSGQPSARITTDKNGYASVYYTLGASTGTNTVTATASGLTGSPITFTATAIAGSPALLYKVSGDNQKGTFGAPLANPLVVALTDSFSNPIVEHDVQFHVSRGGGKVNGTTLATVQTNNLGQASVVLTLGTTDYVNQVTVSGQYLGSEIPTYPSPLIFYATTAAGDAHSLVYFSGNHQVGAVNQVLPELLKVQIVDAYGVPVNNFPVLFQAITPGTHFGGSTQVTKRTDDSGIASVMASIGSNYGDGIYCFEARAELNSVPLINSPYQFFASGRRTTATKLVYRYGSGLAGTVGQYLADSLSVRTVTALDKPVAGQPVQFEVFSGSALLNGQSNSLVTSSDAYGIARMAVKLGSTPGVIKIRASAEDGLAALANSPIEYEVTAQIGSPDGLRSLLNATTPVTADGKSAATIIVTLKDNQGNQVQGKRVSLYTAGLDVHVTQPTVTTDANGQTQGTITSTRAGTLKVWSMVDNQIIPQDTVEVVFVPGPAAKAEPFHSGQITLRGTALPQPIGLYLYDANNNPVPGVPVTFRVKSGGGSIVQIQPVTTNADGLVQVNWRLGSTIGEQYVAAVIPQMGAGEIEFWAYGKAPEPNSMVIVSGDRQIGLVQQALPDSFIVALTDSNAAPAEGLPVIFSQTKGQGDFISTNPDTTDKRGYAAVLFRPGVVAGEYTVMAYHVSGLFKEFHFIVQERPTVYLSKLQDAKSTGRPFEEMPLQAVVRDAYGQPLPGESLQWEVLEGNGSLLTSAIVQSDDQGKVSVTWKLGLKGQQSVKLSPVKYGGSLVFRSEVINSAPELTVPAELSVLAGERLTFTISAFDIDGDAITYGVRNIPAGAVFDSTQQRKFSWTPTRNQASPYTLTFIARDAFQAADTAKTRITITSPNTLPSIDAFEPGDTTLSRIYGQPIFFQVFASDLDNDSLSFEWLVNDLPAGYISSFIFLPDASVFPSDNIVRVRVSDGKEIQELRWHLYLKTSVELSALTATAQKAAVVLTWRTASETNNLGFNVLRCERSDGSYERLNAALIPAASGGSYTYADLTAQAGKKYYYKIQDVDRSGTMTAHGPVMAEMALPLRVALVQNYPNPFNPSTTIGFELPTATEVDLAIYNLQGQLVRRLVQGQAAAGVHSIIWDARDANGIQVPTGLYYYRLRVGDQLFTKKLLFAK